MKNTNCLIKKLMHRPFIPYKYNKFRLISNFTLKLKTNHSNMKHSYCSSNLQVLESCYFFVYTQTSRDVFKM